MRRLISVLTILVVLAGMPPAHPAAAAPGDDTPRSATATTTDRLNLRAGPSLADAVITVMPAGATVTLSGQEIDSFVFVTYGSVKGWAHKDYLDIAEPPADAPETAITTDRLNLRTGPGLTYDVIAIMPAGATVTLTGQASNGYQSVSYNGQRGWAFSTYLSTEAPAPAPNEVATTTDRLNLRAGPSTADGVVTILPAGATVTVTGAPRNAYYPVTWGAYSGWAHGDWLDFDAGAPEPEPEPEPEPMPTTAGTTTDALNLRSGPSTADTVLTVIPRGTKVALTGERANGYLAVAYNGQSGWAHGDWIAVDGAAPAPVDETATTTDTLNLRAGPATTYQVLAVMPAGASVTLTGQTNNGFHSVAYNGQNGWAFSAYLSVGAEEPPPPPDPEPDPEPEPVEDAPFDVTNTIVGPPRGSADEAIDFARRAGAVRMDEVERYIREVYRLGPQIGFDPAIIVAQSALETGYWRSDRWRLELNPAGLGISGGPNQTQPGFASGTISARAQMAHMHAEVFGSSRPLPPELQGVDPTYQQVFDAGWAGTIRTIEDLSGTWAVDPEYHFKIVRVAREIFE